MLARLLNRDGIIVLLSLLGVTAIAWLYLLQEQARMAAMDMSDIPGMDMAMPMAWDATQFALAFAMWWIMMLGMMLPGAAPMILIVATIARRRRDRGQPFTRTAMFVLGYLLVWGAFCIAATLLQWALDSNALLSPTLRTKGTTIGGVLFLLAGVYQLTPLKTACLRHCRSPFAWLFNHWRDGSSGALRMGLHHGLYCLGCCWVLMLLLFAVGAMSSVWVALIAGFVLAEKLIPGGIWISRIVGVLMLAFGAHLLTAGSYL